MKKRFIRQIISVLLSFSMIFSITSTAFASTYAEDPSCETYVQEIVDGHSFMQRTAEKSVVILTNDPDHIIDISIKYESDPTLVYNWTIYDYPVTTFSPDDSTFWVGIIECVESNIDNATIFEFSFDETDENCFQKQGK